MKTKTDPNTISSTKKDDCQVFKTTYFPDGSAIIINERGGITLIEAVAKYEVNPPDEEPN